MCTHYGARTHTHTHSLTDFAAVCVDPPKSEACDPFLSACHLIIIGLGLGFGLGFGFGFWVWVRVVADDGVKEAVQQK